MTRKRHKPEEIVAKLRQVDVLVAQGTSVAEAIRSIGVTEVGSGTSCSMGRSSTHSERLRSSSRAGGGTTYGPASCLTRLQATGTGGVRASLRRLAGCAHPTGSAGQAPGGATAHAELTFNPDHQRGPISSRKRVRGDGDMGPHCDP